MILKDKVVIVTGASDGIGRAIAERLAKEGAKLALIGRDQAKLDEVVKVCEQNAHSYVCDVRDKQAIEQTVGQIVKDFDSIDILVNNAGVWQKLSQLDEISADIIDEVIDANLKGTIFMTKYCLPHIRENAKETAIVNVISRSGVAAQEGQSVYTASKYGTKGFTDVLRVDLKNTNVRIGAVYQAAAENMD